MGLYLLGPKTYHEVNGILQQALFLVHTSSVDGFSNVIIQAWMQGKPTISLWYDPDNMMKNNDIGLVSGEFEQLVRDTKTLLENPSRREGMGQRAKKLAEAHFTPEVNIRKFEQFFLEICEM
jgi:glycosyltransferase involved in cell wall biosynthesis